MKNINTNLYMAKENETLKEHTEHLLEELELLSEYSYINDRKIYELVKLACTYHDIGKINNEFQNRIKLNANGNKVRFNEKKEVPHNILSAFMINKEDFGEDDVNEFNYKVVLHAVANHHNYQPVIQYIKDNRDLITTELNKLGFKRCGRLTKNLSGCVEEKEAILVKGYLHKCDYSASAGIQCEYKNDFLENRLQHFLKTMQVNNIASDWNEMQHFCLDNKEKNIIVVAQTGMGKTEGALNWIGNNKGYFVLPLRTAINSMYERISNIILDRQNLSERIAILHSTSLDYYLGSENLDEKTNILNYEDRGKKWSLPLNISTMDQIFDFVYKYQGYELNLTTLSYSKIVIDEIQMYDPHLLAYLIYGIEMIAKLGGKIAIITATLPPFVKDLLKRKVKFNESKEFTDKEIRHHMVVNNFKISVDDILKKYQENLLKERGNKILVVCNTVTKAKEVFQELKKKSSDEGFEIDNIKLLHSRFIRKDRRKLEEDILDFGRTFNSNNELDEQNGIWVSTSLVEASLDIDFDYLFTELQDLCSLFQRMGRCNRKGKKGIEEPNCYVYTEINPKILKTESSGFIDEQMYNLAKKALGTFNGKISEHDKLDFLNTFLTTENVNNEDKFGYLNSFRGTYNAIEKLSVYKLEKSDVKLREIYSSDVIPSPIYELNKDHILDNVHNYNENINNKLERSKYEKEIMDFTVSIPYYQVEQYRKAVAGGKAESYPIIKLGYKEIKIIDCEYSYDGPFANMGFCVKDYKNNVAFAEFL